MIVAEKISDLREHVAEFKRKGQMIGFVPTMGALHAGHQSLMTEAKTNGACVASVFVNPTQFGQGEDFQRYPRNFEHDRKICEAAGVDILFVPQLPEIYPKEPTIFVQEIEIEKVLCGAFRPGHFRGVCTVVAKLLNIVDPHVLYLGQKDAQQLRILEEMILQLHFPVRIQSVPTYREKSGLALSSRNSYLTSEEKIQAAVIYKALSNAKKMFDSGIRDTETLEKVTKDILVSEPAFRIQYAELVDWIGFARRPHVENKSLLAIAGYIGSTRLIDNIFLQP